jgi:hypothetical protein
MMGGGGDFGERQTLIPPSDYVSRTGYVDLRLKSATRELARAKDLEQFGMERATV